MYCERGHLTLAHTDAAVRTSRWRAEVNKHLGVNSELIYREDIARLCPAINLSEDARYPVLGALYHPPGSIARHDAVAWGYARGAAMRGVHIHHADRGRPDLLIENGTITGVHTNRGTIHCDRACRRWRAPPR